MVVQKTQHATQPGKGPAVSPGRFGLLLILLIVTYLLSAFTNGQWIEALRVILFAGAALLALRNAVVPPRTARLILIIVLAGLSP